ILAGLVTDTDEKHKQSAVTVVSNREVMVFPFYYWIYFPRPGLVALPWRGVFRGFRDWPPPGFSLRGNLRMGILVDFFPSLLRRSCLRSTEHASHQMLSKAR